MKVVRDRGAARAVITGASGLLGANFCLDFSDVGYDVVGVYGAHRIWSPDFVTTSIDLTDPSSSRSLTELAPDLIVHCAAATDVDRCQREPEWARLVNVTATEHVATAASKCGAVLVHISTDAVFSGSGAPWKESDSPAPLNVYARTKLEAERVAMGLNPSTLVVRTVIYGWNAQDKASLAEWVLGRLESGDTVPGFVDARFTPILANDLGDALRMLVDKDARGVLHVAGRDSVSKYEFAVAIARQFGFDPARVVPTSRTEAGFAATRASDLSLDCSTAAALGIALPSLSEGLERFATLRTDGFLSRLKAMTQGDSA
jgi:dTDP-4-dehydrorhamnose reductase